MLITLIFSILLLAVMFAWFGKRDRAMMTFTISFIVAVAVFFHHMTSVIGLAL